MEDIISRNRRRLVQAKMLELEYKTNSHNLLVNLSDGSVTTVELSEYILEKALIKLFESMVYTTHKRDIAQKHIADHYSACTTRRLDKLSSFGGDFIDSVISNLVEQAFAERGGK